MTSGVETEWDYSGRKGRDGQKKKIGKANEKGVKRIKDKEVNGQEERGVPRPHTGHTFGGRWRLQYKTGINVDKWSMAAYAPVGVKVSH